MDNKSIAFKKIRTREDLEKELNCYYCYKECKDTKGEYTAIVKKSLLLNETENYKNVFEKKLLELGYDQVNKKFASNRIVAVEITCKFSRIGIEEEEIVQIGRKYIEFLRTFFNQGDMKVDNVLDIVCNFNEFYVEISTIVLPINETNRISFNRFLGEEIGFQKLEYEYAIFFEKYQMKKMEQQITNLQNELLEYENIQHQYQKYERADVDFGENAYKVKVYDSLESFFEKVVGEKKTKQFIEILKFIISW